jgi:hypothetical protein
VPEVITGGLKVVTDGTKVVTNEGEVVSDGIKVVTNEAEVATNGVKVTTGEEKVVTDSLFLPPNEAVLPKKKKNVQMFHLSVEKGRNLGVRYLTRRLFNKV